MGDITDARQSLAAFLKRVRSAYKDVRVILFGSRARGDAREWSDYDVLLISPSFRTMKFYDRLVDAGRHMWGTGLDIDMICLTPDEFEKRRNEVSIIGVAAREGVELTA